MIFPLHQKILDSLRHANCNKLVHVDLWVEDSWITRDLSSVSSDTRVKIEQNRSAIALDKNKSFISLGRIVSLDAQKPRNHCVSIVLELNYNPIRRTNAGFELNWIELNECLKKRWNFLRWKLNRGFLRCQTTIHESVSMHVSALNVTDQWSKFIDPFDRSFTSKIAFAFVPRDHAERCNFFNVDFVYRPIPSHFIPFLPFPTSTTSRAYVPTYGGFSIEAPTWSRGRLTVSCAKKMR